MGTTGSLQRYNSQFVTAADIPAIIISDSTGLKVAMPAPFAMKETGCLSMNAQGAISMRARLAGLCCTIFKDKTLQPGRWINGWMLHYLDFLEGFETGSLEKFFCFGRRNFNNNAQW